MIGINRYDTQKNSVGAGNLNGATLESLLTKSASELAPTKPCVFLSHQSADKLAVKAIGEHIKERGVDIYLDIDDPDLQLAVSKKDDKAITKFIDLGIKSSSNLLTIISEKTKTSWWVPYEIGYGRCDDTPVAVLKLKDVTNLPSYLTVTQVIEGISNLDVYIDEIKSRNPKQMTKIASDAENLLEMMKKYNYQSLGHPLSTYLNK